MFGFIKSLFNPEPSRPAPPPMEFVQPKKKYLSNEELDALPPKTIVRLESTSGDFSYSCYRVGDSVAINMVGNLFGNCGSHGVYLYDTITKTSSKSEFQYMDQLIEQLLKKV